MSRAPLSLLLSAFIFGGLMHCRASAQEPEPICEFNLVAAEGDTLQDYLVHVRGFTSYDPTITNALVPVYVVREIGPPPSGTPTLAEVDLAIEEAANYFAEYGLHLVKVGQEDLPVQQPLGLSFPDCRSAFELRLDAITVYANWGQTSVACALPSRAVFAEINRDRVIVHELGHTLGLYHTFQGNWEQTYLGCPLPHVDQDRVGTWPGIEGWDTPLEDRFYVGDMVVDTPPDPCTQGFTLPDCTLNTSVYEGYGLRACVGDSAFFTFPPEPIPLNNFMTYVAEDRMYCRTEFTDEQRRRMLLMIEACREDPTTALYSLRRAPEEDVLFPNGDTVYAGDSVPISWSTEFEYDLANPPNLLISSVSIEVVDPTTGAVLHAASELPHTGSYSGWTPSPLLAGTSAQVRLTFNTTIDHPPAVVTRTVVIEDHPDAPQIENLTVALEVGGDVTVTWETDIAATGVVVATNDVDSTTFQDTTTLGTSHQVSLPLNVAATWQIFVSAVAQGHVSMEARYWSTEFATTFTNVSDATGLSVPFGSEPYASAPLDFDADEDEDLLISFESFTASLNRNSGGPLIETPGFEDVASLQLHDGQLQNTRGIAVADFNGDSRVDVLIADNSESTPSNLLLAGTTTGLDSDESWRLDAATSLDATGASFGDFDGDGWLDLYVLSHPSGTGDLLLHLDSTDTTFADATLDAGLRTGMTNSTSVAWADVNLDGRSDLVVGWGAATGSNEEWSPLYVNQGADAPLRFLDKANPMDSPWIDTIGHVEAMVFADITGDRKLDLIVATDEPSAQNTLLAYINDGGGNFTLADSSLGLHSQVPLGDVAVTDFDGNGVLDIIAVPKTTADVVVLSGHGDVSHRLFRDRSVVAGLGPEVARGVTLADFNRDTDADIFLLREELSATPNPEDKRFFWSNNLVDAASAPSTPKAITIGFAHESGPNNHNTMGIGARVAVEVIAPGGTVLRSVQMVDGGSGRGSQGSGRLVFGLAGASNAQITVRWPHGQTQVFDAASFSSFPHITLTDTSDPEIQSSTVTASYVPSAGYTTHTYTWKSNFPGDTPQVLLTAGAKPTDCLVPLGGVTQIVLDPSMPEVSTTSVPVNGEWVHTLTWASYCMESCNYLYFARIVVGGQVYSSLPKTLNVSVCADIAQ